MMHSFLRRLEMLNFIRQHARAVSTERICEHLLHEGYLNEDLQASSALRKIQRDLKEMLGEQDEDGDYLNPLGLQMQSAKRKQLLWSIDPYGQQQFDFEKMPTNMALTLALTQKHLAHILPSKTNYELQRFFTEANNKLRIRDPNTKDRDFQRLKDAVEFYQRGQSLSAPEVRSDVLDACYRGILQNRQLRFDYRRDDSVGSYTVNPCGVAFLLPKVYLIATKVTEENTDIPAYRSFLVHKIEQFNLLTRTATIPQDFNLKRYLEAGGMDVLVDYRDDDKHRLQIELCLPSAKLINDLRDSPIHPSQTLQQTDAQTWLLQASVKRSIQLRQWIINLGSLATVIAPESIRNDIKQALSDTLKNYP